MITPFADCATALWDAGWAPIPLSVNRKPLVNGFNEWKHRAGKASIEKWAKNRPEAGIGILAGFGETKYGQGTIIIDYDDSEASGKLEEAIGRHPTPCMALSKRGEHHTYAAHDEFGDPIDLRHLTTLRHHGINVDIKHHTDGRGVVIMPKSIHKDGFTQYRWKDGSGPEAIKKAPPFPIRQLEEWLDKQQEQAQAKKVKPLRDDSRAQGLNDFLVSQVAFCDDFDGLLDVAETWNDEIPNKFGKPPLDHGEVYERANVVWCQHLEKPFIKMFGSAGYSYMLTDEIHLLSKLSIRLSSDAFMLMALFRSQHSRRCARGETFAICPDAMWKCQTIEGWSRHRYRTCP